MHEGITDTLILAQIDLQNHLIALVSIPRDLFYHGRKINTLYLTSGIDRLLSVISAITGVSVKKYVAIDMYAFIDVVNILGGIDIELTEDLVDPTYRIKQNGEWTTLFYPAGKYHFNGLETLRIARSRHFTSDFGRSERQQKIVEALMHKMGTLSLTDMGTLYQLISAVLPYVDTNLSPLEILGYITQGTNFKISGTLVLNTDNILYHNYTNLRALGIKEEEAEETFDKGAYILLPLEDDWELLKEYIQTFFESN